ncbi:Tetratricopeptide region [Shewanella denitrificans OS217]|jgi:cytochrome c-type biogenesis protein CcmH|uniref:Tetratricopeptide region n=1 Tax=Shewanella denitrificans (strain OS217 / ATCC BAA-1090 / DSM 15013) TaxID=318161 RepID=Q12I84_SHEDO|nr:c-type cytochrome biogenesis protein CcmI [Shewanella denitrificans]ABE56842.1 Tetratricopeptide region [Shewanella denitrificans OS217]
MTLFWIAIALVVFSGLLLIWIPHFRQQHLLQTEASGVRKQTNLEVFAERLANLEQEFQQGQLEQQEFAALKQELEVSLLQDIKQVGDDSLDNQIQKKGLFWPSLMSITLLALSGYLYQQLGAYQQLAIPMQANDAHSAMGPEMALGQRIKLLEAEVQAQPDNSQAWFTLGHAYITNNQYNQAIAAFDKVMELVGVQAELLGPKATALYYQADQTITAETQVIIDKALALDPKDPSTLLLVGMDAFFKANYPQAIDAWQLILSSDRSDIDRGALINAIDAAKAQLHLGPIVPDALKVTVTLAPQLADKLTGTDTLYVFARSQTQPKTPLLLTKLTKVSFPLSVTLDASHAINEQVNTTGLESVEIVVLLSKGGSLKPQTGDIQAKLANGSFNQLNQLVLETELK